MKMEENKEFFDKEQVYKDEVIPLMKKLNDVCDKNGIPHMIWIVYLSDKVKTGQGLMFNAAEKEGHEIEKMHVLARIANDDIRVETLASAALASMAMKMFHGSDSKEASEESK